MDRRWRKKDRNAPEGTPWNNGICSASIQEWLQCRATDPQRDKLDMVFNQKLNMSFPVPDKRLSMPTKRVSKSRPDNGLVTYTSSRASTPSLSSGISSLEIQGSQSGPGMGLPPGMAMEGWNQTEGGARGEVDVKPHRAKKKHRPKKSDRIVSNRPYFNPPRQLTSYEAAYMGSEIMPEVYENVREVTNQRPVPNQSFVSEWGDDMKKTDMTVWKKNLTTSYTQANQEVHQSDTNKALRENKANVFYNWARRKKLYYGDLMNPESSEQVSEWLRSASNEDRDECLEVLRTLHSVVEPLGAGCTTGGTWEHEVYRAHRPSSADKNRGMEYRTNKDRDGHSLKAMEALAMRQRVVQERDRLKIENRNQKATEVRIAELKAEEMMKAKAELLYEFTPEYFRESQQRDLVVPRDLQPGGGRGDDAASVQTSESLQDSPMLVNQEPSSQYKLKSSNDSSMKNSWGFSGTDPNYNKTSYQMAHGANIPELMMNIKKASKEKVALASNHLVTTPSFGAVNYVGYEHTSQPREYSVPRHFTDGLKPDTFAKAFIPTPNMMKHMIKPPKPRTLRPTSSSVSGSAARRDPTLYAATNAARRHTMSARNSAAQHLGSKVAIGNSGMSRAWGTTYTETHKGLQKDRPITAPAHAIAYKTSI
mmetsp:Transcript_6815/g.9234  ORF Transcript_6815/g.9234 Transcript_6815/m.9234 type:complete len:649 (+) Transcript_6815:135-2081(+)|eukprot:CAMPEP_0196588412 /NCGR_PEP_ID=MMETSP1081-20130531/60450_1 /TAXON_ID=36882 /ORGANISM="Pyramimonas amylifera, Strain CCMP720" /LENGTH=648 /DNA_ID=CAMNT_0041910895 /DNA_START=124 /DNA_END=2070 /DNA_ORIENTATION=-